MPYGKRMYRSRTGLRSYLKNLARNPRKSFWAKKTGLVYSKGMKRLNHTTRQPFGRTKMVNQHIDGSLLATRSYVPPSVVTKHRYVERVTLYNENTIGITGNEKAYRLGSMFDPDYSGTGHQPWGYDQMAANYQQYQVYKVKIAIRATRVQGVDPALAINIRPNTSGYNLQSKYVYEIMERPFNTVMMFDMSNDDQVSTSGKAVDKVWEAEYYLADIEGLSRLEYSNDTSYKGLSNNNPTKTPIMSLVCGSGQTIPGCAVGLFVEIEYYCKWTSPVTPGES